MKIGICSDSHDHVKNLRKAIVEFKRRKIDALIHAGDYVAPFSVVELKEVGCPVYGVYGNCDGDKVMIKKKFDEIEGEIYKEPHIFEIGGKRIVTMHQPIWVEAFRSPEVADIIVHGHTHELRIEEGEPWVINPGEIYGRLSTGPSVVIYDTEKNDVEVIWIKDLPDENK